MADQYQVVGALAAFTVTTQDGTPQKVTFYKGQMVPEGTPAEEIEHHLSVRLIAKVGSDKDSIPAMTGPLGTETSRPPEGNALAEPVDRVMAPASVSPSVATSEQVDAGTAAVVEQQQVPARRGPGRPPKAAS